MGYVYKDGERYRVREGKLIRVGTLNPGGVKPKKPRTNQHFGCPLKWVKRVLPLIKSKEQLAVAIWLHRRRAVCRVNVFDVPNETLRMELGLDRKAKYRALHHLERAGVVALVRDGNHAIRVQIL